MQKEGMPGQGMNEQTIIIADDHPLFRDALRQAVGGIEGEQAIVEAGDFEAARAAAKAHFEADLMLLDLSMPGASGFSGLMSLRADFASLPIVVISASDDSTTIRRALELGASGFISKSSGIEDIRRGVRASAFPRISHRRCPSRAARAPRRARAAPAAPSCTRASASAADSVAPPRCCTAHSPAPASPRRTRR